MVVKKLSELNPKDVKKAKKVLALFLSLIAAIVIAIAIKKSNNSMTLQWAIPTVFLLVYLVIYIH